VRAAIPIRRACKALLSARSGRNIIFHFVSLLAGKVYAAFASDRKRSGTVGSLQGHKEELLAIEDSQVKVTGVVLGIFGTGGAFLASMMNKSSRITPSERWRLTLITSAIPLLAMVSG